MKDDVEARLRDAFAEEPEGRPAPLGLRGRVMARARAAPQRRLRHGWALGLAPAVAVVAAVLVVGLLLQLQSAGPQPRPTPAATPTLLFGRLPAPGLHPAAGLGGGGSAGPEPYYGPAAMTWTGTLPAEHSSAPVYRVAPASAADVEALRSRLVAAGYKFSESDDPVAGLPFFSVSRALQPAPAPLSVGAARAAADAELDRLGLSPPWPVAVAMTGPLYTFHYQRVVDLGGGQHAGLVDGGGDPLGIDVAVDPAVGVVEIRGLVPTHSEEPGRYPLAPPNVQQAISAPPQIQEAGTAPAVVLTEAQLVYIPVRAGDVAYVEPAYMFSGTFSRGGGHLEKRVLIPAVSSAALTG